MVSRTSAFDSPRRTASARAASEIRTARADEASALGALAFRSKAHWGYAPAFMEACRAELAVRAACIADGWVFVLDSGPTPIGFCALEPLGRTRIELVHLFVEPERIGRGCGRRLLEHAADVACSRGFEALVIQSDPNAAAFYQACGARLVGERTSGSVQGRSLPLFELELR